MSQVSTSEKRQYLWEIWRVEEKLTEVVVGHMGHRLPVAHLDGMRPHPGLQLLLLPLTHLQLLCLQSQVCAQLHSKGLQVSAGPPHHQGQWQ